MLYSAAKIWTIKTNLLTFVYVQEYVVWVLFSVHWEECVCATVGGVFYKYQLFADNVYWFSVYFFDDWWI